MNNRCYCCRPVPSAIVIQAIGTAAKISSESDSSLREFLQSSEIGREVVRVAGVERFEPAVHENLVTGMLVSRRQRHLRNGIHKVHDTATSLEHVINAMNE